MAFTAAIQAIYTERNALVAKHYSGGLTLSETLRLEELRCKLDEFDKVRCAVRSSK